MRNIFSLKNIGAIVRLVGTDMNVRLTPYGNVVVKHVKSNKVFFTFYQRGENGVLIRRRLGYGNPMGSGNVLNNGKPFPNLLYALKYFKEYKAKHPNSIK